MAGAMRRAAIIVMDACGVGALPDAEVSLVVENATNALHLRCNKANYKLLGLPADEFPLLPQVKEESRAKSPSC